jgi:hypothetical protein
MRIVKKLVVAFLILAGVVFSARQVVIASSDATMKVVTPSYAVDSSATSPQYLDGLDLTALQNVDDSTVTSSLLGTTIDSSTPSFVFKFVSGYTPPSDEVIKTMSLRMVYKYNVGSLSSHYVVVRYINGSGSRVTCVSRHNLPLPATSGTYYDESFDVGGCKDGSAVRTIELYYYVAGLVQPVNVSFDHVGVYVSHGNPSASTGGSSSGSETKTTTTFVKSTDVSVGGGTINRGPLTILFGQGALPYETSVSTEVVTSPLVSRPYGLAGNIYKLNVLAAFNGYPLPSFKPSLLFMTYPACTGRPVIVMSTNGKNWRDLFTVRTSSPANTVAAVVSSSAYYAVSCR